MRRLRDTLLNEMPTRVEPAVCYAVPSALDSTRVQAAGGRVDMYGFDFDAVPLQLVLVTSDGYQDVTPALVARSPYHLVVKLGDGGVPVSRRSQSLGLAWGHLIRHAIPLFQPTTPICSSRVETIPSGRTVSYTPLRVGKDRAPARSGGAIWADASLDYSSNKLEMTVCVTAADPFLSGCTVEFLYTTDADRVIDGVLGNLGSRVAYEPGHRAVDVQNERRRGPVQGWAFSGFRPDGVDSGETSVTARLNQIRLVSSEGEGCLSPITYLEAKRTTIVNPSTVRVLDPQLKRIDRAILKLRPRFAPATRGSAAPLRKRPCDAIC